MCSIATQSVALSSAPAQSIAYTIGQLESVAAPSLVSAPAQSVAYTLAQSVAPSAAAAPQQEARWADYSPEEVELPFPALPEPDNKCYVAPKAPAGQTRYLAVEEPAQTKNLNQNFNDVRTAVRENNTHLQRNKTQITQVNRQHNHLLRIVTNENNFEHNLTNKIVRVADTHRQKIENVKGETRNFKDFKQTQKVEKQGCRNDGAAPAQQACAAPAASIAVSRAPTVVSRAPTAVSRAPTAVSRAPAAISLASARTLAPSVPTKVQYL